MKNHIAILYSDSEFTPWNENIDSSTIISILNGIPSKYKTTIIHMTEPNAALASLLKQFDFIINICYGYRDHSQSDVANWLDKNKIEHLSSMGITQAMVEDKRMAETKLINENLPVVPSFTEIKNIGKSQFENFIVKPIKGGCHRGISTYTKKEMMKVFNLIDLDKYLIQPYISGREFSVAIIPNDLSIDYVALQPIEIIPFPKREIYIAGQQYGVTQKILDPFLTDSQLEELKTIAVNTHKKLKLKYYSRIDFRMANDQFFILDVNSMPNLHPKLSMLPIILNSMEISFTDFMERIIAIYENKYASVSLLKTN